MYEVELKVRADLDRVRERLGELGAQETGHVRQVDTYYDAPHREFAETDEALRLRRETVLDDTGSGTGATGGNDGGGAFDGDETDAVAGEPTVKMTYKGPLVERESKTRREHETAVADGAAADGILSGLGFEPAATVEKDRRFFALDGYTVTLDAVAGLGEFVEVETEVEGDGEDGAAGGDEGVATDPDEGAASEAVVAARERAVELLDELGLDAEDQIRTSYLGLQLAAE